MEVAKSIQVSRVGSGKKETSRLEHRRQELKQAVHPQAGVQGGLVEGGAIPDPAAVCNL